jgi:hypothetical protein
MTLDKVRLLQRMPTISLEAVFIFDEQIQKYKY